MKFKKDRRSLFEKEFREEKIAVKDPLSVFSTKVNWEPFRPTIEKAFSHIDYSQGGRPPFDRLLMFKILILQEYYGLSDDQVEFQILDRLSFQKFLGQGLHDTVPDAKTIWAYRENLTKAGVIDALFAQLKKQLVGYGLIAHKGTMIDASFAKVPIQRNTPDENKQIKKGERPEWDENKDRQKDTDANWAQKGGQNHFGYKQHIKADVKSKLITKVIVTAASIHETNIIDNLIDKTDKGQALYADSAYKKITRDEQLKKMGIIPRINSQGYKNRPMTEQERKRNKINSSKRCRVEHIFGWLKRRTGAMIRGIGIQRVTARITLRMIGYNLNRAVFLIKNNRKGLQII